MFAGLIAAIAVRRYLLLLMSVWITHMAHKSILHEWVHVAAMMGVDTLAILRAEWAPM